VILIDTHEPVDALLQIQIAVPCQIHPLNDEGWADYKWTAWDGEEVHVERKQWGELTAGIDRIEYQLRQEKAKHPKARLILLVEGVATPSVMGTQLWQQGKNRDVYYKSREQNIRYSMVAAWLYQVNKYMEVVRTADFKATCVELAAMCMSDQKEEHSTFQRYLKVTDWHPNPQVEMLMAIGNGVGVGSAKADALARRFGTVWNVLSASPQELQQVEGFGKTNSIKLLRKVGRPDV
jgi:ERCC4-type nuclease